MVCAWNVVLSGLLGLNLPSCRSNFLDSLQALPFLVEGTAQSSARKSSIYNIISNLVTSQSLLVTAYPDQPQVDELDSIDLAADSELLGSTGSVHLQPAGAKRLVARHLIKKLLGQLLSKEKMLQIRKQAKETYSLRRICCMFC